MAFYRPRGLARIIYEKFHNDRFLDEFDTSLWYKINQNLPKYQSKFVQFDLDETTKQWIERSKNLSGNIWTHLWHALARSFLQFFMTQTDINGCLKRGSMFILSEQQYGKLLHAGGFNIDNYEIVNILDVGAGDGEITLRLTNSVCAPNVRVFATETSWTMKKRLEKLNFSVIENIKEVSNLQLISCLNVLDRCIDPFELLEDMYNAIAPNGRVLLALVLPYMHFVEFNTSHLPLRPLMNHWPEKAKLYAFEVEAVMFFEMLENVGFQIESWTKAPYLCEGDLHQSFYWLIDLVVVLSKKVTSKPKTN